MGSGGAIGLLAGAGWREMEGKKGFQGKETTGFVPLGWQRGIVQLRTKGLTATHPSVPSGAAIRNFKYVWLAIVAISAIIKETANPPKPMANNVPLMFSGDPVAVGCKVA